MISPKVLLVDDETAFVDALERRLTRRGFETLKAFDGATALERLDTEPNIEVVGPGPAHAGPGWSGYVGPYQEDPSPGRGHYSDRTRQRWPRAWNA